MALRSVMRRKGIMLTTYGMVQHNAAELDHMPANMGRDEDEDRPVWDWVFLDEVGAAVYVLSVWNMCGSCDKAYACAANVCCAVHSRAEK